MKGKKWCRHIKLFDDGAGYGYFLRYQQDLRQLELWLQPTWKFCPICGKRRPR